ncbi:ROK family protein [Catellatospora bangladeshensis]|uniref:Sugar kinase n=1 Tax=Catellatospora bangladeshensis TaxID=310355 RepID=A0A8J3JQ77_9ACTN|nr:ROK family protein [Catellatospora bangladeshensis]GIF81889.1 sugar kinase [Catellatospora bangladeshensis]
MPQRTAGPLALAVDIGGTKMAAGLVTADGTVLAADRIATPRPAPGPDAAAEVWAGLRAMLERLTAAAGGRPITGVGTSTAGPFDLAGATVSPVNITAWRGFPLVDHLAEVVPGVPVRLAGDGVCAAIGEHWRGAGRGHDDLLVLVVSTGVGGGLIHGGRPFTGRSGNAGHVGHMVVDLAGEPCPCGGRGCVEALASGPSMVRYALREGWRPTGDGTARDLADAARGGHPVALAAFTRSADALAAGIVSAAAMCDLNQVVIGGGVAHAADLLFPPLKEALARYGRLGFLSGITLRPAHLGTDAGLIGAAALIHAPDPYWPATPTR